MNPIGIQSTKQTIDALLNGASMFIVPIYDKNISIQSDESEFLHSAYNFECDWCKGKDTNCTDCHGFGRRWDIDCESKQEFISNYSKLQIGDEFFIREDFIEKDISESNYFYSVEPEYEQAYRNDYSIEDKYLNALHPKEDELLETVDWQDASEMTEEQSRYKGVVVDIEVKKFGDIRTAREMQSTLGTNCISKSGHVCIEDVDKMILGMKSMIQNSKDNPYVFLYTVKRIKT